MSIRKAFLVLALVVAGCVNSPIRQAETLEQKAYAAYGTFVIVEESVVKMTAPGSALPADAQRAMIASAQRAQPVMDQLLVTIGEYEAARADFEAARAEAPALQVVLDKLEDWVVRAEDVLDDVKAAVRGGQ